MSKEGFSNEEADNETAPDAELMSRRGFLKLGAGLGLAAAGVGCAPESDVSREAQRTEEGFISDKRYSPGVTVRGIPGTPVYFLYFQFPTHTERAQVNREMFGAFQKGEEVVVTYEESGLANQLLNTVRLHDIQRKN